MDLATIIGVIAGLALIVSAGTPYQDLLIDPAQLLFVVGGGLIATLVAHPLAMASKFPVLLVRALFARPPAAAALVERIVAFAETGRREGILALENKVNDQDDRFLRAGTMLAVDGTEPDLIMDILETELQFIEERHRFHGRVLGSFGRGCVLFGGISALMAITLQGGSGLAGSALLHGAGLPLLYGVLVYGLMEALSHRLQVASAQEVLHKRMVIEGVMSIQSGDNPRIVEHKLSVFLEPSMRPGSGAAPEVPLASMPDADDELVKQVRRLSAERRAALSEAPSLELDEILSMSDHDIQVVLRAMDQRDLVVGLKGAPAQVREKFLSNMSVRVRNFIQQEIGDCDGDADKIAETQIRMAQQLDYLAKQKKIELPESDA